MLLQKLIRAGAPPRCHRGIFISRRRNENVRDLPRQRGGTPTETHARLSAEVADIFRRWRDGKFRDDSKFVFCPPSPCFRGSGPFPRRQGN